MVNAVSLGTMNPPFLDVTYMPRFSVSSVTSFFTFNMFCAPCFAAVGAIHRELGTWKATGFAFLYQCLLAYFVAVIVFVVSAAVMGAMSDVPWYSIMFAIIDAVILVYFLVVKDPFKPFRKNTEVAE